VPTILYLSSMLLAEVIVVAVFFAASCRQWHAACLKVAALVITASATKDLGGNLRRLAELFQTLRPTDAISLFVFRRARKG
jgi:hypothetical protein